VLLLILIFLGDVYFFCFTDWFRPKVIQIAHSTRAAHLRPGRPGGNSAAVPMTFSLDPKCKPTEILVVPLAAWLTNRNTLPVWHLVAASNGMPVKILYYGQSLRGLKPAVAGTRAAPLQPDTTYRLFLTTGDAKGQHDFTVKPAN
jgi:hypothetical protein